MKIGDITKIIEEDSCLDKDDLARESLKIPYLQAKYYKIFIDEFKILKGLTMEYNRVKKERTLYYLGKADDQAYKDEPLDHKIMKTEVDVYLNGDEKLATLEGKMTLQKAKVDMVEAFIKSLNNRGFQIKNAIDWLKFQAGA